MSRIVFGIIRILACVLSVAFTIYFCVAMNTGLKNIGSVAGLILSVWIMFISIKPVYRGTRNLFHKYIITRFIFRFVNGCFILFAVYGALVTIGMIYCASIAPADNSTAVVLGAQVKSWGPSIILRGRINAAEKYLADNPNTCAVLSGGQGNDEIMSEAQSMYENLTSDGIEAYRLYIEDKSVNTTENIKNSLKIINESGLDENIAVVTDGFHQLRVRIIAHQLGLKQNVGAVNADTSLQYLPVFAVREWFALPNQILFR